MVAGSSTCAQLREMKLTDSGYTAKDKFANNDVIAHTHRRVENIIGKQLLRLI